MVVPSGKFDVQVAHFEAVFAHADHEVDSDSVTALQVLYKGRVGRVNKTEVFGIVMLRPLEWLNLVDLNRPSHDYEFTCSSVISLPLHLRVDVLHPNNVVGNVEVLHVMPSIVVNSF